jgi:AcrR family transcriptional regulator
VFTGPTVSATLCLVKKPVSRLTADGLESVTEAVQEAVQGAIDVVAEPIRRTGRSVAKAARDATRADGRSSRWIEHRVARREELIDAAVAAVKEFGTDVGMDQIAATANTSKPVIYRYFADKNDLYRAVGVRVTNQIVTTLLGVKDDPDPRAMLHASIDAYLQLLDDNPQLFRFVTQNRLLTEARPGEPTPAEFSGAVTDLLTAALAEQLRSCGLDPVGAQPWGEAAVGFIRAASLWWLDHPQAMTRPQLTEYLAALLWGGAAGVYQSTGRRVDGRPAPGVFAPLGR